ncbi:hypothetical protein CRE_22520 [Caenorhabditis remanei]|uniref:RING-type domain-containing protein n=1 Tax=Caenorhabditis remanei TaxID=31234 RepID=E3MU66_CAERE|nr:hypothetical protein CRE_22520 [Caenorhabditis remanei]
MSKYLEIPNSALTPMCLRKEADAYMLEELRKYLVDFHDNPDGSSKGKEAELIQMLMNASGQRLRMYGTAREYVENLKIFRNFSSSHIYFNTDVDSYQTNPIMYHSTKNKEYIMKSDLFPILQNITIRNSPDFTFEFISLIAYFLKTQEEKLNGKLEFVRFDAKILEEIEKEYKLEYRKSRLDAKNTEKLMGEMSRMNFTQWINKIKSLAPNIWKNEWREQRLRNTLGSSLNTLPTPTRFMFVSALYLAVHPAFKALQKIIDKRSKLFSVGLNNNNRNPPTVRVFEDGNLKFMMKSELFGAISMESEDENDVFHTIDMKEVLQKYGKSNIEFLRHPIRRTKHRAVPIRGPGSVESSNDFFILAVDALFEFLKDIIIGAKIFQNDDFSRFSEVFKDLEQFFMPELTEPYFIRIRAIEKMKEMMMKITENDMETSEKDVRNVNSDGFSVENLKDELKFLGLTKTFPEIEEFSENVFSKMKKLKKGRVLTTSDMYDAVEMCQINCVMKRVPNLQKVLHNQKGCSRIPGLHCEGCKTSDLQKSIKNLKISETSECLICCNEINSKDTSMKCPLCKKRFHSNCALNWLKEHKQCPTCNGNLQEIIIDS